MRTASEERELPDRYPMRRTFVGCCASTLAPHIVSATAIAKTLTHFRFWIADFRLSEEEFRTRSKAFSLIGFLPNPKSKIQNYLITRSARARTFCGIVRPICLAAFRLMTN